jgi:hypothetical protein
MKNISLVITALVIFAGTIFAQQTQGTTEKKERKTEKKALTSKHVKKDSKADTSTPATK